MKEDSLVLKGSNVQPLPRPNRTWGPGRTCAEEGCTTELSIYNRAKYCWAHAPVRYYIPRGRKRSPQAA